MELDEVRRAREHWARGEPEQALVVGDQALARATAAGNAALVVVARLVLGHAYHARGLFLPALDELRAVLDQADPAPDRTRASLHRIGGEGQRPLQPTGTPRHEAEREPTEIERAVGALGFPAPSRVVACALGAECLGELGDHAGALDLVERGERAAEAAGHAAGRITLAASRAYVHLRRGEVERALGAVEPALSVARDRRLHDPLGEALTTLGDALTRSHRPAAGVEAAQEAIRIHEASGVLAHRSYRYAVLAAAHAGAGQLAEAGEAVARARALAERHAERAREAWSRFTAGEIARAAGDPRRAEEDYDEAQDIAEELAMRPLVERCRAALRALR